MSLTEQLAVYESSLPFVEQLERHQKRLDITDAVTAQILGITERCLGNWKRGRLPKEITQEGSIARLAKEKRK